MKKSILVIPLVVLSLTGCNPTTTDTSDGLGNLLSIELVSGLKSKYVQYEIVELEKVAILAEYENGMITVLGDELDFGITGINTSAIGYYDATISYSTETLYWSYEVFENNGIEGIETPDSVMKYNNNIKEQSADNKRKEFMDRNQGYLVGDDNPFIFVPTIYTYIDDEELYVYGYHSVSTIEEKRESEWVLITGS